MQAVLERHVEAVVENFDIEHAQHKFGCIKGSILGLDENTGHVIVIPLCCKSWTCPACAERLLDQWTKRTIDAQPERFLTWTVDPKLHPDPHEARVAIQKAWTSFVAHWRKGRAAKGLKHKIPTHTLEYISVWERHKSGHPHLHALIRGEYIPQSYLKQWSIKAGCGSIIDIRKVENVRNAAAELLKYVTKAADDVSGFFEGFRLINCSRHFMPDELPKPTDENTPDYVWQMSRERAAHVLTALVTRFGYTLAPKSLGGRVELVPHAHNLNLEEIVYETSTRFDFSP